MQLKKDSEEERGDLLGEDNAVEVLQSNSCEENDKLEVACVLQESSVDICSEGNCEKVDVKVYAQEIEDEKQIRQCSRLQIGRAHV